jgi:hypothetical protein
MANTLIDKGFDVESLNDIKFEEMTINYYKFNFVLEVSNKKGSCLIVPYHGDGEKREMEDYILYLTPTVEEVNEKNKNKEFKHEIGDLYDVNTFNHYFVGKSSEVEYTSLADMDNLTNSIDEYIDIKSGRYGFLENETYRNDIEIRKWVKIYKESLGESWGRYFGHLSKKNKYDDAGFDVFIQYHPPYETGIATLSERLKDTPFLCEGCGFHFYYNKRIDAKNCILEMECVYFDLTEVINGEWDSDLFYINYSECKKYMEKISHEFRGSYSKCFDLVVDFIGK